MAESDKINEDNSELINAPAQVLKFGPCAEVLAQSSVVLPVQDPSTQRLQWLKPPKKILMIQKVFTTPTMLTLLEVVKWLVETKEMIIILEKRIMDDELLTQNSDFKRMMENRSVKSVDEVGSAIKDVDLIICIGGDGTHLFANKIYQHSVPPVLAFNLGSIGFLTPFDIDNYKEHISSTFAGGVNLTLRQRLKCVLLKRLPCGSVELDKTYVVLNEVVVDRGIAPIATTITLFFGKTYSTTVQGDGVVLSTTTGSTTYSVSAGGSMVHPCVSAIVVTPICADSLSFRPIIVPAGIELQVCLSEDSKTTAWVSFDGFQKKELHLGDLLVVRTAVHPFPTVTSQDQISDWFASLGECLRWNLRRKQSSDTVSVYSDISEVTNTKTDGSIVNFYDNDDDVSGI